MLIPDVLKHAKRGCKVAAIVFFIAATFTDCRKKSVNDDVVPPALSTDKTLKSFYFTASKNPVLMDDVFAEVKGDTIYAATVAGTDIRALVPEFSFEGSSITVNGIAQESNITPHNFTDLVTYTVIAQDKTEKKYTVKFTDTGIPALYVNVDGSAAITSKEVYVKGVLKITSNFKSAVYEGKTEIKGHGNSTWSDMPKKPYRIKLDKKAALLGMPENKNWILLANYADKSLMRNELTFMLSRSMGRSFTPASRYVELYLNGEYRGNYQLTQQVREGPTNVDIEEQATTATTVPDITGGYLIEQDLFASSSSAESFFTTKKMPFVVKYPDVEDINVQQKDYIKAHFQKFEDALFAANFADPANGYRKYFDVNSYVDYYIISEVIGNPDMFRSNYMYKKRNDDKIYTGPVWDYDKAANNDNRLGNQVSGLMLTAAFNPKTWINRLMQDQTFRQKIRSRWNELKAQVNTLPGATDQLAKRLAVSQVGNFKKWDILKKQSYLELNVSGSYAGDVAYLKTFLTNHILYLDTKFNSSEYQ